MSENTYSSTLEVVNNTKKKIGDKVIEYGTPRTIASIIELTISIFCSIGINFVAFKFDYKAFTDWSFYLKTAFLTIGVFLMFRSVVNALYPRTEKREKVINAQAKYNALNAKKKISMKTYLKEFNLETKVEVYIAMINKKIAKIERKMIKTINPKKVAKLSAKLGHDEVVSDGEVIKEATGLKMLIASSYIAEHIEHMNINYPIVYYDDFVDETPEGDATKLVTKANYNKAFNKASFNKMWCYLLTTGLLALSMPEYSKNGGVYFFTSLLLTICMIAVRIASAIAKAPQLYDSTITKSYYDRIYVLERYLQWEENHPTSTMLEDLKKQADEEANARWQKKAEQSVAKFKEQLKNEITMN